MPRDYRLQIDDIAAAIDKIRTYTRGMTCDDFSADTKTQDAVIRNLEVIGEAARALPEEVRNITKDIDWRKIISIRNILIHEYFGVSLPIIWDVVVNKLDELEAACRKIIEKLE